MEQNVTDEIPRKIRSRFELAARGWVERWLEAGHMRISASDLQIVREFLELAGMKVEDVPGLRVRLVNRQGRSQEVTREAAAMMALRRLADEPER